MLRCGSVSSILRCAVRCGFQKSGILRCDSVRLSDIVNPMVRFGAVIHPRMRFSAVPH